MGWSGRGVDLVRWGLWSMSKYMFHHQKTAIQKTTVATRDPPNSSLPFKLNNPPNCALEISTNISTQNQTRTYQVGLSSQSRLEKASPCQATRETFLGVVCPFLVSPGSFPHSFKITNPSPYPHLYPYTLPSFMV